MNILASIIHSLDYKYEVEVEQYFTLPESEKDEIATVIANALLQDSQHIRELVLNYIVNIQRLIKDYERIQSYEKCDLFQRIQNKLFDKIDNKV